MPYEFAWEVKDEYSGNDYSHQEKSDGLITNGQYSVLLPDGRTQIVTFVADHQNGYKAEVTYEGEASYPQPTERASYNPPGGETNYSPPVSQPSQTYSF